MKIIDFNLEEIIKYLQENKAVIMETDTVIGIYSKNLKLLYDLKQRPKEKKIVTLVKDVYDICQNPSTELLKLAKAFWPGKLTIIYKNTSYRIPNNEYTLKVIDKISPIFCTSANISGQDTIRTSKEALNIFKDEKDDILIINGVSYSLKPSTIYNLDTHTLIREGDITLQEIEKVIYK